MNKVIHLLKNIKVHPLLWVVMGIAIITAHFTELSLLLFIIFVHEMGHAAAAAFFSWRIKRIMLLPFGGVAEMDEHGNRPLKEEVIVIISGPLQHIWMMGAAYIAYASSLLSPELFSLFIQYNLMILIFNLLPIWPLDGGKLIFLCLSLSNAFPTAHKKALYISAASLMVFFLLTVFMMPFNINIWIVLAFLIFSLYYEWKQSRYVFMRFLLERHYGKNSEFRTLKPLVVNEEDTIIQVLQKFQRGCKHSIIVEKKDKEKMSLDENELLHAYFSDKILTAKIGDLVYVY